MSLIVSMPGYGDLIVKVVLFCDAQAGKAKQIARTRTVIRMMSLIVSPY